MGFEQLTADRWRFTKDPDARRDMSIDWADWLADGDTLAGAAFTVPAGLTKHAEAHTATVATVRISGGVAGSTYEVVCLVTTTLGEIEPERFEVRTIAK